MDKEVANSLNADFPSQHCNRSHLDARKGDKNEDVQQVQSKKKKPSSRNDAKTVDKKINVMVSRSK